LLAVFATVLGATVGYLSLIVADFSSLNNVCELVKTITELASALPSVRQVVSLEVASVYPSVRPTMYFI
jgi:ABC-type hemin transport system substrate-binding protein